MTDSDITIHYQQQAMAKVTAVNDFTSKMMHVAGTSVKQTVDHLQNIIKWDTAELSLLRELEHSVRSGSALGPVATRLLGEIDQLRKELIELNDQQMKELDR